MRILVLVLVSSLLAACQTVETSTCVEQDWFEIGRKSGAMGERPHDLDSEFSGCREASKAQATALYENGRLAGLSQYCQPSNAYELGKLNQPYLDVCPKGLESDFKDAYSKGQRVFDLNVENNRLEEELMQLKADNLKSKNRASLLIELQTMRKKIRANSKQIRALNQQINSTQL